MTTLLLENLLPLYILIGLGYIAGRWLDVNLHSLATVAIYILSPVVVFGAILKIDLAPSYLLLPVIIYTIAAGIAFAAYKISHRQLKTNIANLIGMASGTGNTGYYGLPIVLALFGPDAAGVYLLMNLAIILNELTVCYYIGARGHHTMQDSLKKVVRLPALHAAWLALLCNILNVHMPEVFDTYWHHFTGAWVVIGMMLIGVGLAKIDTLRPNKALLGWLFGFRFIAWPLLSAGFVALDRAVFKLYGQDIHTMIILMGLVPLAANTVAFAGTLKLPAGEAAMAVLLSTLFALFYLPLMLTILT